MEFAQRRRSCLTRHPTPRKCARAGAPPPVHRSRRKTSAGPARDNAAPRVPSRSQRSSRIASSPGAKTSRRKGRRSCNRVVPRRCAIVRSVAAPASAGMIWPRLAGLSLGSTVDRVPVDERETETGVVDRKPGAAARFVRINRAAAWVRKNFGRLRGNASSLFVAVHRETKSALRGNERDRAHSICDRVTRCPAAILPPLLPKHEERGGDRAPGAIGGADRKNQPPLRI